MRSCPVCSSSESLLFLTEKVDKDKINNLSYASRKEPEFMRHKLVKCNNCSLVYAPDPPSVTFLADTYKEADYDSDSEAKYAAQTYIDALDTVINKLEKTDKLDFAVDIGAGNGALLPLLIEKGFEDVLGIEPSLAAIENAPASIKEKLKAEIFCANSLDKNATLICSFMTFEHIENIHESMKLIYNSIESGGYIAIVVHNYEARLNRMLGAKSPIIDIEHLQLFSPKAIRNFLESNNFSNIEIVEIKNAYPISYWLRLCPFPKVLKKNIHKLFEFIGVNNKIVKLNVGNILATARKK